MCKQYGYCRISRKEQNIERQERNIRAAYPEATIVKEVFTGTKLDGRKRFEKLLSMLSTGDTVIFDSVSRMSRNAEEGFALYEKLFRSGIELVFLKEPQINTETYKAAMERQINAATESGDAATDELIRGITDAINRYMLRLAERQILIAFEQAEKEVSDLHQRTKEGIETARINGKQIGGVPGRKLNVKKAAEAKQIIRRYSMAFNGTLGDPEVIRLAGISRNTFYKYKREIKSEF